MALPRVTTLAESNGAQPWLGASPQYPGRIRDEALQEHELDVGDAVLLISQNLLATRAA